MVVPLHTEVFRQPIGTLAVVPPWGLEGDTGLLQFLVVEKAEDRLPRDEDEWFEIVNALDEECPAQGLYPGLAEGNASLASGLGRPSPA